MVRQTRTDKIKALNLNNTRKIRKMNCSPRPKSKTLTYTCFTEEMLIKLKRLWNARHPDSKIDSDEPKRIWKLLNNYLSDTCNNEVCWLNQSFIRYNLDENLKNYVFAPNSPETWKRNPNEWLSSIDILKLMKHYEKNFKKYEFFGPSPIDFNSYIDDGQCVWEELCNFNLKEQVNRGKTKLGFIFNLDKHYEPGSHWVALFISVKHKEIYYFDSYGDEAPLEIIKLVRKIQEQAETELKETYVYKYNKMRHQYGNSECGMYSLYFLIHLIREKPFEQFNTTRISDKYVERLRKKYFN